MKIQEEICQAHMAGQFNAGCTHPSWSEAFAYWKSVEEKFTSHNKQSTPLDKPASFYCQYCGGKFTSVHFCNNRG